MNHLSAALVLGVLSTSSGSVIESSADDKSALTFNPERAGACLAKARTLLSESDAPFSAMEQWLDVPTVALDALRHAHGFEPEQSLDKSAFAGFEGAWCGSWDGMDVRHVWLSRSPDVQLVVLQDGEQKKRAVNVRDAAGTLCGIVMDGTEERQHLGARKADGSVIWATPSRRYREHVVTVGRAHWYEIRETILDDGPPHAGVVARYRRYPDRTGPAACRPTEPVGHVS